MTEEDQKLIESRLAELGAAVAALQMNPPRNPALQELPYHVNTLMQRAMREFAMAFDRVLREPERWTAESQARLESRYSLWRDEAADFAASLPKPEGGKDYFRPCRNVFPGGEAREEIAAVIERMEALAPAESAFGGSGRSVRRDYLNMVEVLTESRLLEDEPAIRRLTEKVYGTTETAAEALAQLELELAGAAMLGQARRNEFAAGTLFQSGEVDKSGFALEALSSPDGGAKVYGLVYPGHFEITSWCYLTIGQGVMIASQPGNGDCGTSLTNVWSAEFIGMMTTFLREQGALPTTGKVELYEHYIDRPAELDRVDVNPEADIVWSGLGQGEGTVRVAFERLVGPMPEFESFSFGLAVERLRKESRQSDLQKEVERSRRTSVNFGSHLHGREVRSPVRGAPER